MMQDIDDLVQDPVSLCAAGAARADKGDTAGAVALYRQAVALAPNLLDLHFVLANGEQLMGDEVAARATLRHALRVAERSDTASEFALGKALVDVGAGADAVTCFRRVKSALPGDATAIAALGAALRDAGELDDAWREISTALRITPDDPMALLTAARIRHDEGEYADALQWCERALAIAPELPRAHMTRGYLRHLLGDATGGWADFESRAIPDPGISARRWTGEPLDDQSLLVLGEQGIGDQLQFVRFARHPALNTASRIVVSVHEDLVPLFRACSIDAVARDTEPRTNLYVPMLSLPHVLGLGAETLANAGGYLAPDAGSRPKTAGGRRRVGLVWAGNPAHRNDRVRSMPGSLLSTLLRNHPGVEFVSLQRGVSDDAIPAGLTSQGQDGDWLATARQLSSLDLLITVDTGIAHLAGALGRPVWLLLPRVPDWRWGATGNGTPWYPSARLFRQTARGDWAGVLTRVSAALSMWSSSAR